MKIPKKDNGTAGKPPVQPKRPPAALFLWLLAFLGLVSIIILYSPSRFTTTVRWTTDQFMESLNQGLIVTAEIMPESDKILHVTGEFRQEAAGVLSSATEQPAEKPEASGNNTPVAVTDLTIAPGAPGKKLKYITRLYATDSLIAELESKNVAVTFLERNVWWKEVLINVAVALPILLIVYFIFARQIRGAGRDAFMFGKSRARIIMPNENKTTFDDVAGCEEAKEEIKEIVDYLKDPLKFKLVGGKIPHGALLTGPPGTGKTLLARAVSGEAGVPFFSISGSDFVEMFVGVGASRVRDMFSQARKNAPSLIFIDEIDAVGRSRFSGIGGGHDEREQTLNAMLVEMDGLEKQEGVIVLAATNRPDVLDPALLRPGRFDRQIVIDLPDIKGRRKILDVHIKDIRIDETVDLDIIAKSTPGFSGADLANLVNEAALLAARKNQEKATHKDFEEARDKVCFGSERRSRKIPEHDRKLTAWHESGHAIVNLFLEHSIPLHKVTIIPRGQALGLTMMMEHEDRYSRSRNEMLDIITTDLGGRVAEELALGDITGGASQDIEHATNLAHAMVCSFGMSDTIGTIRYGERGDHIYLGREITRNEACSEQTQREIDMEIKRIVQMCKERATKILTEQRARLDALANALLEKETLSAEEIHELLELPFEMPGSEQETDKSASAPTEATAQETPKTPAE